MTLKELRKILNDDLKNCDENMEILVYFAYDDFAKLREVSLTKMKKNREVDDITIWERGTDGEGEVKLLIGE